MIRKKSERLFSSNNKCIKYMCLGMNPCTHRCACHYNAHYVSAVNQKTFSSQCNSVRFFVALWLILLSVFVWFYAFSFCVSLWLLISVVCTSAVKKDDCFIHFDYGRSCNLSVIFCFCFVLCVCLYFLKCVWFVHFCLYLSASNVCCDFKKIYSQITIISFYKYLWGDFDFPMRTTLVLELRFGSGIAFSVLDL